MLVTLIGKNSLYKVVLPKIPIGNYWITDNTLGKEKKLVNVEGKDGHWQIKTEANVKVINSNAIDISDDKIKLKKMAGIYSKGTILKEYNMYALMLDDMDDEIYILYCSPACDNEIYHLNIENIKEFYIGSGSQCQIIYDNLLVSNVHAKIFQMNGRWVIDNFDKRIGTFINGSSAESSARVLLNGDVIFILGLKIIIMGNSIFINNPSNKVKYSRQFFKLNDEVQKIEANTNEVIDNEEIELYNSKDYFSRAPRITNIIEKEKVKIDAPPKIDDKEEMPAILVLGSSLSMGLMMMISVVMTIDGRVNGTASAKETFFSLAMAFVMLISMILFPILTQKWEKKRKIRYEEKRQKRYKEYLNQKRTTINKIKNKQREILYANYVSIEECTKIILHKESRLWERKIEDYDFLSIRWGIGNVPLKIDLQFPEEQFEMEDDNLLEILHSIADNSKMIEMAPIVTSLVEKNISGIIVKNEEIFKKIMQNIIIQLISFHSYEDLKIVFLVKKGNDKYWEYVKMLPHVWNFSKTIRFFADDIDEMREISSYLEQELRNRQSYENNDANYKMFMPYYLIITDDYKRVENLKIINEIQKNKTNLGFSLLSVTSDLSQLPNECKTFVSLEKDKKGIIFDNEISENNQREIAIDIDFEIFFEKLIPIISNIPIRYSANGSTLLPNTYTFLEMYDVGLIEQLNILERWKRNDTTISLKAPIGIDSSGMPIILDIHEKVHGPHGLIAGSTGSGKSEFIITYILSLAINYAPDDVSFLLIDYKGGGLAGAFQKGDTKLPHIVGTITNIDTNGLQRSLASIQSELRRRQIMFNEARNLVDEGTIDIYKYQKLYHEGIVKKPIPHLLIICDEFAELKQQQEEFMDELISVSRIGRSLGVHLILATQKPAGIVNDQIRSNSKFAICLKVQDVEDSNDVIKKPDAANLKGSGQFYMQVGNDDYFVLGQSAWAGAPYYPSNTTKKTVDTSIQFVSNVGIPIKDVDNIGSKRVVSYGEQLTNIVRYIIELAKKENIKTNNLWLEDIPENIYLDKLKKKYPVTAKGKEINVIIGEYDDPYNQKQGLVNINYTKSGNVIIYGNAESGKETLLSTIVYDLITTYSSKEVQIYILDFGSEVLKIFKNSPHVGDVTFISEFEKISRFFEMIQREIKERKNILSNYNGDYELYVNTKGNTMPMLVAILNNYEAFDEMYGDKFDDLFLTITREGIKCGIVFTVTTSAYNNMRYRLTQNFRKKIALQLNNEDDYYNIFEKAGKKKPSSIFGRGLVTINDDTVYEFQTAKICQAVDYNSTINETIEMLKKQNNPEASEIPTIPDRILVEDIKDYIKDISKVPIGITKKELKIFNYDFKKNFVCTMTSKNIEDVIEYVNYLIKEISMIDGIEIVLFDAENTIKAKKESLSDEIDRFMAKMNNKKINATISHTIVIINGLDKFISDVQEEYFYEMINNANEKGKYSFIIIEKTNKFKNHEYDEWYKKYVENDSGIYIGNGIEDQYFIEISDRQNLDNNCGRSYGYVVIQGLPTLIKLVGMKEAGEENE